MTLLHYTESLDLTECEAMNLLQDHGIISDLCASLDDVAEVDAVRAVEWLRERSKPAEELKQTDLWSAR